MFCLLSEINILLLLLPLVVGPLYSS